MTFKCFASNLAIVRSGILCISLSLYYEPFFSQSDSSVTAEFRADTSRSEFAQRFANRWNMQPHSPLKATIYSAIIPGGGQVYNGRAKNKSFAGKYWRVPVVWAGIGTCIGFIDYNTRNFRYYKQQYLYEVDGDNSTTANQTTREGNFFWMEQHKKWLDISYLSLAGVYLLQIIEANVDAHLFYYDVGKDLTFRIGPALGPAGFGVGAGVWF